jgi:tetrathionate reductase subunit B
VTRYAMVIDYRTCIGCGACVAACTEENSIATGKNIPLASRTKVGNIEIGEYPNTRWIFTHSICRHCENPPCVTVCPTGASFKTEDGVVLVDHNKCIGCKYCIVACPYGARYLNEEMKGPDKCTFCHHRVEAGLLPACVEACPTKSRVFGDLDDPNSKVSKLVAEGAIPAGAEYGTKPKVYIIPPTSG